MMKSLLASFPFLRGKDPGEHVTRDSFREEFGRFRILIIGRANAGKTTILKQICNSTEDPVIYDGEGNEVDPAVIQPSKDRGIHNIENELVFRSNPNFVFHDSQGFEAGSIEEFKQMRHFVSERAKTPFLEKRIHTIWYCIPMDQYHRSILSAEEKFFNECDRGDVPVVLVFTKCDALRVKGIAALTAEEKMLSRTEMIVRGTQNAERLLMKKHAWMCMQSMRYPPKTYVELMDSHMSNEGCKLLLARTIITALNEEVLETRMLPGPAGLQWQEALSDAHEVIRACSRQSLAPNMTEAVIGSIMGDVVTGLPRVLIDTTSGRLCNHSDLLSTFQSCPTFTELTTTQIDHARIKRKVSEYYRYATLSHTWEGNEPLFKDVMHVPVNELEKSITHNKLRMFCKIAKEAGFHWAWSDTCCIDKSDPVVLQEALVLMFKWYQGSALTIIFLRGVRFPIDIWKNNLEHSFWNTRAWTLQEYHASKIVRFYTEDWALYLGPDITNHKESPRIIEEMERATMVSAQNLMSLKPGLNHIRDKLRLASTRKATRFEDKAYSLLGIFSASLPLVYGEGDSALGRLLARLLTSSGDTSILAWTGTSGEFNSCFPHDIAVFKELPTTHIPAIDTNPTVEELRALSLDPDLVMEVYDRIQALPAPEFAETRMKLPCICLKLGLMARVRSPSASEYVFRAQVGVAFGTVEIRTKENLSRLGYQGVYLIHPWIEFLLNEQFAGNIEETTLEDTTDSPSGTPEDFEESLWAPSATLHEPEDRETQALQLIARLMQPFGALLFAQKRQNGRIYERVATESKIAFQVKEMSTGVLKELLRSVRTLDVL